MSDTSDLSRQLYMQAGNSTIDGTEFVNSFMSGQYGAGNAQFPTAAPTGSLAGTVRAGDYVYSDGRTHVDQVVPIERDDRFIGKRNLPGGSVRSPKRLSAQDAYNAFVGARTGDITGIQQQLVNAGYLQPDSFLGGIADKETKGAYQDLLNDAAESASAGRTKTIQDILRERSAAFQKRGGWNQPGSGVFTGSRTTTSTESRVDYTNPSQARAVAEQTLGDLIGRRPDQAEFNQFLKALHAAEAKAPTKTSTTTTQSYDKGVVTGSHSNVVQNDGGVNPEMVAESQAYDQHGDEVAQMGLLNLLGAFRHMIDGGQ